MTFLRSYEGFIGADVSISAPGCERLYRRLSATEEDGGLPGEPALQGWWNKRVSIPFTVTWATAADHAGIDVNEQNRFALPPGCYVARETVYALNITLRHSALAPIDAARFKLLRVSSCGMFIRQDQPCCRR